MNLFEKQNKPFAIKLSERVKEEIEKTFNSNWYSTEQPDALFHYPNLNNQKGFEISFHSRVDLEPNYTLITEAEFFGDGNELTPMQELIEYIELNQPKNKVTDGIWAKAKSLLQKEKQVNKEFWNNGMKSDNGHFGTFEDYYNQKFRKDE